MFTDRIAAYLQVDFLVKPDRATYLKNHFQKDNIVPQPSQTLPPQFLLFSPLLEEIESYYFPRIFFSDGLAKKTKATTFWGSSHL